jgi:hypothetical protein
MTLKNIMEYLSITKIIKSTFPQESNTSHLAYWNMLIS